MSLSWDRVSGFGGRAVRECPRANKWGELSAQPLCMFSWHGGSMELPPSGSRAGDGS